MAVTNEDAKLLIKEVTAALEHGLKHYRKSNNEPLLTVLDIITALSEEGSIILEEDE